MPSVSKTTLRQAFDAYRRALAPVAHSRRSRRICARTRAHPALHRADVVHLYWPALDRGEVDTRPLIGWCQAAGKTVVLPVVTSFAAGQPDMEARTFTNTDALVENRWGLHEPVHGTRIAPHAIDLVIVPAFGVGRRGHRIGHGGGFYDRFLADLDADTLALAFDACLVDTVPSDDHDVPVQYVVTETETVGPLLREPKQPRLS
ncbi:5-formyltetrahydrofolate cyclo-ligase [Longimonas halophila]|uniref:5-formyltetrahydrofolate cyclo-ligase n=1 Tax=Longimonas halophila TaxID=1469170 RepID=A0A2H3NPI6_9BACT|nr:5-formyltetrahydrofolate cyclo-ligase [Longimonas halophila]PEN07029.1 5-formyltetrahydrofolate cyclo-ligase [Longimonas halophila]